MKKEVVYRNSILAKGSADRKLTLNAKSVIIDALFDRIKKYGAWDEQEICLEYLEKR